MLQVLQKDLQLGEVLAEEKATSSTHLLFGVTRTVEKKKLKKGMRKETPHGIEWIG